jgi:excisionase family DNA binding protein
MPNLLTRKQVAEYLKVSYLTVYRWERSGKLPSIHIGAGSVRYRHADVEQFITAAVRP